MSLETIYTSIRPGFPKLSFDEQSYRTTIEYVGLSTVLQAESPALSTAWGDYVGLVTTSDFDELEGTSYGILTVICERKFDTSGGGHGAKVANETTYEIDWVDVSRSMYEHPQFAIGEGGDYELEAEDIAAIKSWEINPDTAYKKDYIYRIDGDYSKGVTSLDETLSENAQMFARGIQLGIEHWVDKVPVAIQSDTYVNGPPPAGSAGEKIVGEPTGFPSVPEGYEWIKDSETALRAGGQTSWTNKMSWLGSKKVLVDTKNIFWTL